MSVETQNSNAPPIAWDWLKSISRELYNLDETPLLGTPPSFPWEKLSLDFARAFSLDGLKITPGELAWKENDAIMSGIAKPALCTQIAATGIDGSVSLWMCREDVQHLMAKVLKISEVVSELQADDVVTNFHRFLGIETICLLNDSGFDPRLSFKITAYSEDVPQKALCQDIKVSLGNEQMLLRLVISNEFRSSWKTFFTKSADKAQKALDQVETIVHIEAGKTKLDFNDLLKLKPGDLVLLDQLYYDANAENSFVLLSFQGRTLFRAKLESGSLKILEIPLQNEVYTPMVEPVEPPTAPTDTAAQELYQQQSPPPEQEDDNPFPEEDDEDGDEGLELIQKAANTSIEDLAKAPDDAKAAPTKPKVEVAVKKQAVNETTGPLTANDIPMELIVEVASISISVQKLLELAPGNLLDLGLTPENGVNLVVNGRVVGKGELLKIGETIGVRILQIGV
ncbi:MAG: type III secretion system cytoplasmic ring protein SctQ [Chlamydiales bacterium]|nr:type III secretion system cytoplasmic ring protein SctQ [Chlamydiales bacterium]